MTWMTFFAENAWKGTAILAAAFALGAMLRGASASLRHYLWTATFAALVALPAVIDTVPKWSPVEQASRPVVQRAALPRTGTVPAVPAPPAAPAKRPVPLNWPLILWMAGCAAAATRFLVGAARTSWMVRRAAPAQHAATMLEDLAGSLGIRRRVRVLVSASAPMPLTWGVLRPVVVLPDDAPRWPAARMAAVLLHELVHVRRLDLLAQAVAQAACCLFWFHPLAWLALRELRKERERACDDAVLERGVAPHDYAGHLMDLVRALSAKRSAWSDAPAMAEASDLESRVRALLDRSRNRHPVSRRAAIAIAAAVAAAVLPFAAITVHAQPAPGALAGVVQDPSGARVPNCRVIARNLDASNQEVTTANPAGEYRFASIPSGRYAIEFTAPGFKLAKVETVLVAGAAARVDANLELGSVTENVVIRGQKSPSVRPAAPAASRERVRVGGMVAAARLITQVKPVYPAELQQLGVEGTVIMKAIISKAGGVLHPIVINTVDTRLAKAAMDAVAQWHYQPALLNGEPVETLTTITLDFQLDQ